MIKWISFPKSVKSSEEMHEIVEAFIKIEDKIDSTKHNHTSNKVLEFLCPNLEQIGYIVEHGKKEKDKIHIPVLFGQNGREEKAFEADAYNEEKRFIIEVEAGRAVLNYQFLKDFYEACMMYGVDYLCIAVRNRYKNGNVISDDYEKVITYFETMYLSNRVSIPLKGILVIGY